MTNGYFRVFIKPEGIALRLYPETEGGAPIDATEIDRYLTANRIEFEKTRLYDAVRDIKSEKEVVISRQNSYPINESVDVFMDADRVTVTARFYPPSDKGKEMSYNDIISELNRNGVRYGAKEDVIKRFLSEKKYCTNYIVAEALPPIDGVDAVITYHFNTDLSVKPRQNEDGSVDFHSLDNINSVDEGALIATLTPADMGRPGIDVCGKPIKQRKANIKTLREVKNTKLSEDGTKLYALKNGHVSLVDGVIFVSDTYNVPANVDTSTGDIKYSGNVVVAGNVITGFKVEAEGDVIVNGVVEGAEIIAGGQIILKRGIQGMQRGLLKAGGNVVSRFIESAEVIAGGYISTDSIMHSKVEAGQEVSVHGKKGFITGGSIKAGTFISCQSAGSVMGTATNIEIGAASLQNDMKALEAEKADVFANIDKITKVLAFMARKIKEGAQITPEMRAQYGTLTNQKTELEDKLIEIDDKIDELSEKISNQSSGYVLVDDVIYPGCKVTISNVSTFIRTDTKHCRLVRDGADIRVKAY